MTITNEHYFGQIGIPLESFHTLEVQQEQFMYMLMDTLGKPLARIDVSTTRMSDHL